MDEMVFRSAWIEGVTVRLLAVSQVVLDVFLEVIELAVWDENVGVRRACFGADAQHLDLLPSVLPDLASKALESQGHIWHAGKLDLEAQATFEPLLLLGIHYLLRNWLQGNQLGFERRAMLSAVRRGGVGCAAAAKRRRRECLRLTALNMARLSKPNWLP